MNLFRNLLIPNGFKTASTHLAKYSIKLFKSEMSSYVSVKGIKLSIEFGEASEVCILRNLKI